MKNKALENSFPHEIWQFLVFYNPLIDVFSKTRHRPTPPTPTAMAFSFWLQGGFESGPKYFELVLACL